VNQAATNDDDEPVAERSVEELQVQVAGLVVDVGRLAGLTIKLTDSRQRGLGFLTFAGRRALYDLVRTERRIRNAQLGLPAPSGDIAVPGNLQAINADAELTMTLQHCIRRLHKAIAHHVCPLDRLPGEPDVGDLLRHLYTLTWFTCDRAVLAAVVRDLETAETLLQRLVDGDDKVLLEDPCPYCGRRTLVVQFKEDLIRCDTDQRTGERHPCQCPNNACDCKVRPRQFRHTWYRATHDQRRTVGAADTWHHLRGLLSTSRAAKQQQNHDDKEADA
jgi:hypothetical protein